MTEVFLFNTTPRSVLGLTQHLPRWVLQSVSMVVMQPEHNIKHSPLASTGFRNDINIHYDSSLTFCWKFPWAFVIILWFNFQWGFLVVLCQCARLPAQLHWYRLEQQQLLVLLLCLQHQHYPCKQMPHCLVPMSPQHIMYPEVCFQKRWTRSWGKPWNCRNRISDIMDLAAGYNFYQLKNVTWMVHIV
jgi:hypothetical protein